MRPILLALAALALSGCIDFQGAYDESAREECLREVNSNDRSACLDAIERNASQRRSEQRN